MTGFFYTIVFLAQLFCQIPRVPVKLTEAYTITTSRDFPIDATTTVWG